MRTRRLYGAALAAHQRRVGGSRRRRTVRRNPSRPRVAARRRSAVRRVTRRSRPAPPKMTPAMRRKVSLGVKRYFAAKRTSRSPVARVRGFFARRRSARRSSSSLMGGGNPLKRILSRDVIMTGAGAVLASLGTGYIKKQFGAQLPGVNTKFGDVAYSLLIPSVGAAVTRRFNRSLSNGMLIGGIILAINSLIKGIGGVAAVSAYSSSPVIQDEYGNFHEMVPAARAPLGMLTYPDAMGDFGLAGEITGQPSDFAMAEETPFTSVW